MDEIYNLSIIRDLCKEKRITHRELAEKAGLSKSGLQTILSKNSTTPKTLKKIAAVLGVDVNIFLAKNSHDAQNTVHEIQEKYIGGHDYKEKYIKLLEEYNKLLKKKLENQKCDHKTNKHDG